ncbi:MAG: 16S rRNA (cytosine(1402)-N(4))-methyltransferase RsmH [Xanthomonadaceae bacterium]|jgi:16S rRNA (cytosine1402-N4)-methyltransferase|nr:16S rRNA (cytosine(1402)-N(4))-methyltransferase RsmH [Xanthomonadaceae bacterium]
MEQAGTHVPVLRDESVAALAVRGDGSYLDGTFGRGGHARAVLARLGGAGRLLVMDKDPEAIAAAQALAAEDPRVRVRHGSFARMDEWADAREGLDGVLLDLGVSSPQIDQPARGFSFQADGPLDMRMDPTQGASAAQWLARAGEREIADALFAFGEERDSRRIARAVVARRAEAPIETTRELAELVARAVRSREPGKHPATRTFQALRIVVNGELDDLAAGLQAAVACLRAGGRLAVISFHSLEDRVVKRFIRDASRVAAPGRRGLPPPVDAPAPRLRAVGEAVLPSAAETAANPRARSAVLRVAERLP